MWDFGGRNKKGTIFFGPFTIRHDLSHRKIINKPHNTDTHTYVFYWAVALSLNNNLRQTTTGGQKGVFGSPPWQACRISDSSQFYSSGEERGSHNMKFFGVPEASISSIYSKLAMRTFDVYANILKCMYSTRFNGGPTRSEASSDAQPTPCVVTSLTHPINTLPQSDKYKRRKKESPKERDK